MAALRIYYKKKGPPSLKLRRAKRQGQFIVEAPLCGCSGLYPPQPASAGEGGERGINSIDPVGGGG